MTFIKKCERKRGLFLEYPVFDGEDSALANSFEERFVSLVRDAAKKYPRCSLTTKCEERDGTVSVRHLLTVRGDRIIKKELLVTFKDGYIVKYEEV